MPFGIYAAMLGSHLVVTVADRVPEFDVGRICRDSAITNCATLENWAQQKLKESWSHYAARDKAACTMEEKIAGTPSYTGWLTCLDINANARRVDAASSKGGGVPEAGRGGVSRGVHRRKGSRSR